MKEKLGPSLAKKPMEFVEALLILLALLPGLYIITPYYPINSSVVHTLAEGKYLVKSYGAFLVVIGILGGYGIKHSIRFLRRSISFTLFFVYLYFTFVRIIVKGWNDLIWVSVFVNALIAGIVFIWLRWQTNGN